MAGFNKFGAIATAMHEILAQTVRKVAYEVSSDAYDLAPKDTGFLADSIYVRTVDESTYGQAGSPPGDSYLLPEVDPPESDMSAKIAVGANYGVYQELGTRYQPAQPYFYQAVQWGQQALDIEVAQVENKIKGMI